MVTPKYEKVVAAFVANFERKLEYGAQLVLYEDGEKKLDLAGIRNPESIMPPYRPYDGDSVSLFWSTGKMLESIAMCMLVDRGLLEYEARVSDYWPAFAKNGKSEIRVETVLRHDSGLYGFSRRLQTNESLESIGKVIEDSAQISQNRGYHIYTRGLILNQICIRVDPQGRTIGQFLKEELLAKIGLADDIAVGEISEDIVKRVHPPTKNSVLYDISQVLCPTCMGCNMPWTNLSKGQMKRYKKIPDVIGELRRTLVFHNNPWVDMSAEHDFATDPNTSLECTSAWMMGTMRALTKCLALMSEGGIIDGVRVIRQSSVELALSAPKLSLDIFFGYNTVFTKGGFYILGTYNEIEDLPEHKVYGWDGYNGSIAYFEYPGGKAVGYNCTATTAHPPPWDIRGREILRQLGYSKYLHPEGPDDYVIPETPLKCYV